MKIPRKIFKPMIDRVLPLTTRKTTMPMLKCVRVKCDDSTFTVSASSIEEHMVSTTAGWGEPCDFLVHAEQLARLVDACDEDVELEIKGSSLIFTGSGRAELQILPVEGFPSVPDDNYKEIILNSQDLSEVAASVMWALKYYDKDDGRMYRRSLHVWGRAKRIDCNVTNGRIFITNFKPSISGDINVMVLHEFADNFLAMIQGKDVKIRVGQRNLWVSNESGVWCCKLPEEGFPVDQMGTIVEADYKLVGMLLPEELLPHLRVCHSFATPDSRFVDLDFSPGGMDIHFSNKTDPQATPMNYDVHLVGKYSTARLRSNLDYLVDAVEKLNDEGSPIKLESLNGHLKLTADKRPVVVIGGMVRPVEEVRS